jgi:peptidoglycan hydrolase-like protein with peptidoglycan-binding domain
MAQLQHAIDSAQTSLSLAQKAADATNQQDATTLSNDQNTLAQDQQKQSKDCQAQPSGQACAADTQAVSSDQARVNQDQAKQTSDSVQGQASVNNAQKAVTDAADQLNVALASGGNAGVYTALPAVGQVVDRGQTLYAISGRPIALLFGSTPLARQLTTGASGADVKELEENLIALGFGSGLTADGNFTAADATAVKRWQATLGVAQSGFVNPGEAIFEPSAFRVAAVKVTLGASAQAGQDVADGTSSRHVVTVNLDARNQTLAQVGAACDVVVANGTRVKGSITDVGTVATTTGSGANQATTIPVTIVLADNQAAGRLDGATVSVYLTQASHQNVLAVPITALLATDSGYALETSSGHHRLPVTTGIFSNGMVEVSGPDIAEGLRVVVPAT